MPDRLAVERRFRRRTLAQLEAWLDGPMVALSFLWIGLVVAELVWGTGRLFELIGIGIWIIFVAEFTLRFALAPQKRLFLATNWLSAIALLLPAFRVFVAFRLFRLARAVRGLRLLRVVGTANRGMNALRWSMSRRGLGYVASLTTLLVFLGAAGMLAFEPAGDVEGGFSTYGEALWWTSMLLTTMGTDFWPRTPEGRGLCLLLAIYGFAVWGYITASIATFFVGQESRAKDGDILGPSELRKLHSEIAAFRKELAAVAQPHPSRQSPTSDFPNQSPSFIRNGESGLA